MMVCFVKENILRKEEIEKLLASDRQNALPGKTFA